MDTGPATPQQFELPDTVEAIEYYYEQGLTDGLPVVPPTPEGVQRFLEAGGVGPDDVLGTRPSRNWVVTARKVAINAVMAGCLPEYAPVVVASVRALLKPEFNASGIAETAGTSAPLIVVNGPVRNELNINSGWNLFGPGWRANATIGRALRLVLMNVCREIPGITDKSTFGHSGRYTFCIAENEEVSPWEPYQVENGYPIEANTTALFSVCHPLEVPNWADNDPEEILGTICQIMASYVRCYGYIVIVIGPEHAERIGAAGWTKAQAKQFIAERTMELRSTVDLDEKTLNAMLGTSSFGKGAETTPERITLLVAGGGGGGMSTILPTWTMGLTNRSVIQPIDV